MAKGKVTSSNSKIGSLLARISEELEDVFTTAETPLGCSDEGEEATEPLTNWDNIGL